MKREELGILYPIKLVRYDLKWPELFLKEKGILERIWYGQIRIEHIGSTAVPGLSAKPTIDILMEKPLDMSDEVITERMEENEYLHMKSRPVISCSSRATERMGSKVSAITFI